MMVTIAWNPLEFHLLKALPKGTMFNAEYYRVDILTDFLPPRPQVDGPPYTSLRTMAISGFVPKSSHLKGLGVRFKTPK
jgi:hypothetical protein